MHQVVVSIPFGLQETHPSGGAPADLQGMVVELAEAKEGRKNRMSGANCSKHCFEVSYTLCLLS